MKRRSRIKLATTAAIGSLALAGIGLSTGGAAGQSPGGVEFTDWTAVDANVAIGTILGHSISLSGSNVVAPPASVVDGTSTVFNQPLFTPQLATSDVLYFGGLSGYSYTLAFGAPTRDPVLHVANLASTLGFPAGTSITKLSGEDSFTVSGSSVVGALAGSSDASGSVRLNGVFESISFSATPVYAAPTEDGIYLHVGASPEPPTLPPPPPGPENVTPPTIRNVEEGSYSCDPGEWRNVTGPFTYRWVRAAPGTPRRVATTQVFTPTARVYGYPIYCAVTVAGPNGPVTARSAQVVFSAAGLNALPPIYGDARIRGIDVFQTVQPNTGARMFGYEPARPFAPNLCGGGTPTSWLLVPSIGSPLCELQTRDAQYVEYQGVVLDQDKTTVAVVYVDVQNALPADPNLAYDLELSATRGGRVSLGEPVVKQVRNPPAGGDQPWIQPFERDNTASGDNNRQGVQFELPSAWIARGGSIRLTARLKFPDSVARGTAGYGTRQCDAAGGCLENDTFSLNDVPFLASPSLIIGPVELRDDLADALPRPDLVLSEARKLFPGGKRIVVQPYRTMIDISAVDDPQYTATTAPPCATPPVSPCSPPGMTLFTCNNGAETGASVTTQSCRSNYVQRVLQERVARDPARCVGASCRPFDESFRKYDVAFGVHEYPDHRAWASGDIRTVSRSSVNATPIMTARARERPLTSAAHELGHILTAPHASAGCDAEGEIEAWPEVDTANGEQGRLQGVRARLVFRPRSFERMVETTVDGLNPAATPGGTSGPAIYDLMSYCTGGNDDAAWLSARNWNRFRQELDKLGGRLRTSARAARATAAQSGRTAFAVGTAGPSGGAIGRVVPPDGEDAVPRSVPSSPFRLRSLDSAGGVLLDAGVAVQPTTLHGGDGSGPFVGPVARRADAVELVHSGTRLDRKTRSRPPRIRLVGPARGTRVRSRGKLNVRWRASDPDSDALEATVDFSADNGRTWRMVFEGPSTGRAVVPGSYLAGSRRARVRVAVNDGFNERSVNSRPFVAQGTRPRVEILTPEARAAIRSTDRVVLSGSAFDDLDTSLNGRALTWYAGRKRLGRGARIRARLPRGTRRLRLVARDRTGRTGSASMRVRVEAPQLRIVSLGVPLKVGRNARSLRVRIRASAPATLTAGGRRYRLRPRRTTLTIRLPTRPRIGIVSVGFRLAPRGGVAQRTVRGTFSVVRT